MNTTTCNGLWEEQRVYTEAMRENDDEASPNEPENTSGAD